MPLPLSVQQTTRIKMIDRTIPPAIRKISNIDLPDCQTIYLDNGIPLYLVESGDQPLIKLEVVYNAGRPYEQQKLAARATARLLKEGTKNYTSAQIAEQTDFFGSTISSPVNLDTSNLSFYCLSRHLEELLPMWTEILTEPTFPQHELDSFVKNNIQRLQVELTKPDVIAYRTITDEIYGKNHPYGYNSQPSTYTDLQRSWLFDHFEENYHAGSCRLFLSGKPGPKAIELINKHLGQAIKKGIPKKPTFPLVDTSPVCLTLEKANSLQTAIRLGHPTVGRDHADYAGFFVLNTLFGGYFGSRLMANLREDKGWTYHIGSSIDTLQQAATFMISTEIMKGSEQLALKEIMHEIDRLQQDLVKEEELEMVQNYLMGSMLSMIDGPFNVAEIVRTAIVEELPTNYFQNTIETIQTITVKEIRDLAQKHINQAGMWQVTVGPGKN